METQQGGSNHPNKRERGGGGGGYSADDVMDWLAATRIEQEKARSEAEAKWPRKDIAQPLPSDVLYGRGGGTNHHPGNKIYRRMVEERKQRYMNSKKLERPLVAYEIVRILRAQDPPVRFLKKDNKSGLWNDVGDIEAREKTSKALRENVKKTNQGSREPPPVIQGEGVVLEDVPFQGPTNIISPANSAPREMTQPPSIIFGGVEADDRCLVGVDSLPSEPVPEQLPPFAFGGDNPPLVAWTATSTDHITCIASSDPPELPCSPILPELLHASCLGWDEVLSLLEFESPSLSSAEPPVLPSSIIEPELASCMDEHVPTVAAECIGWASLPEPEILSEPQVPSVENVLMIAEWIGWDESPCVKRESALSPEPETPSNVLVVAECIGFEEAFKSAESSPDLNVRSIEQVLMGKESSGWEESGSKLPSSLDLFDWEDALAAHALAVSEYNEFDQSCDEMGYATATATPNCFASKEPSTTMAVKQPPLSSYAANYNSSHHHNSFIPPPPLPSLVDSTQTSPAQSAAECFALFLASEEELNLSSHVFSSAARADADYDTGCRDNSYCNSNSSANNSDKKQHSTCAAKVLIKRSTSNENETMETKRFLRGPSVKRLALNREDDDGWSSSTGKAPQATAAVESCVTPPASSFCAVHGSTSLSNEDREIRELTQTMEKSTLEDAEEDPWVVLATEPMPSETTMSKKDVMDLMRHPLLPLSRTNTAEIIDPDTSSTTATCNRASSDLDDEDDRS